MQKIFRALSVSITLLLLFTASAFAEEIGEPTFEPFSPAYLEWLKEHESDSSSPPLLKSGAGETYSNGYIPFHIDLSYLADNPPIETNDSPVPLLKDSAIPSKYDLRNVNGNSYVTSVKNQGDYGTCWAHASIGAIESNMLKKGLGESNLSEMHLAWFTFKGNDTSRTFDNVTSTNLKTVLDHGGNAFYPTALFTRFSGPTTETEAPYPTQPSKTNPDDYTRAVRLREVYYLAFDKFNVNLPTTNRDIVKRRIMENGSVMASYYSVDSNYRKTASNGTSYYYSSSSTNHAVQIVGWDDSYSRSNFSPNPGVDGAWLIKNSWGNKWGNGTENVGDDGYFWMSYAQYLTDGTAFIAEKADPDMKVYDYSPVGWISSFYWDSLQAYTANVFKAERDNEKLAEVGFYTTNNNINYEIKVYTGMSSMPTSSPINGSPASTMSGTIPYAGWHTVTLSTPVNLTKGQYFSVVVTYKNDKVIPAEKNGAMASNVSIEDGSFFSPNGSYWETGKSNNANATIKAYTVTGSSSSSGTAPQITTTSLPNATISTAYSATLAASGSTPITWSVSSGSLPTGLRLDSSTGVISGTPTSAGSYTFSVTATNSSSSDTKSYTLTVNASTGGVAPTITTSSLFDGKVGERYSGVGVSATGTSPITYALYDGSLPPGLTISDSGAISGTPTTAGTYTPTFSATNDYGTDTKQYTIRITAAGVKPSISTTALTNGQVSRSYSFTLTATGTSPITWTASGLPSGLSVNSSSGIISGTPRTAGTYRLSITARNTYGNDSKTLTLTIAAAGVRPTISTSTLPEGRLNTTYSQALSATGTAPIAWSISSGALPTGLSLNESTGVISGTPTASGTFSFTVAATNDYGTASRSYTVNIIAVLTGNTVNLTGYVGYNLRQLLELSSSQSATWTASGSLPSGISLSRTGLISGRPTRAGNYTVKITASTASSRTEFTVNFVINARPDKPVIRTSSFPVAVVDETYSCAVTSTGTTPLTLTVTGLPDGLTFNESTGNISGIPTRAGTYNVKITAENIATQLDNRPVTKTLRLTVKAQPPVIEDPGTLPDGIMGERYSSVQFTTTKGTEPITWRISGQPSGMSMTTSGLLSGTPSRAGRFTMTIRASNSGGNATLRVPITILQKPTVSSARMSMGTTDTSYTARFTATGTTPITWAIDGLPDTMRYSQNALGTTATITGIPVVAGEYSVNLTLSNVAGSREYIVNFRVRGVAPRLTATLTRATTGQPYRGSRISATGTKPIEISYSISDSDKARFGITSLEDLGLSFTCNSADGTAEITGTPAFSIKNLPITFTATNTVSTVTRRVNFTSAGTTPRFTSPSESTVNILCKVGSPVSIDFTASGSKNIVYTMNSVSGFTLRQTGDYTATLSGTAPARDATTNITITATNADGRATKRVTIRTQTPPTITTPSLPAGRLNTNYSTRVTATGTSTIRWTIEGTLPRGMRFSSGSFSGRPTEAGNFPVTIKATNTIGEASKSFTISIVDPNAVRSVATSQEAIVEEEAPSTRMSYVPEVPAMPEFILEARKVEAEKGFVIAARLPEVSVDVSGMYDFDVELSEGSPVGAKLYWLAYPDGEGSEDDEIAEFYDETGEEIEAVPEDRRISISVWLNEGVKYSPVIAVK